MRRCLIRISAESLAILTQAPRGFPHSVKEVPVWCLDQTAVILFQILPKLSHVNRTALLAAHSEYTESRMKNKNYKTWEQKLRRFSSIITCSYLGQNFLFKFQL